MPRMISPYAFFSFIVDRLPRRHRLASPDASRRALCRALVVVVLGSAIFGPQGTGAHAQTSSPPPSGDALVELPNHVPGVLARASQRARAADAHDEAISLTVVLQYADRPGLDAFLRDLDRQ